MCDDDEICQIDHIIHKLISSIMDQIGSDSNRTLIKYALKNRILPERYFKKIFDEAVKGNSRLLGFFNRKKIEEIKQIHDEEIRKDVIYDVLSQHHQHRKVTNHIQNICNFSVEELESLCGDLFADEVDSFVVFGCVKSTDIDVVVFVDNKKCKDGKTPYLKRRHIIKILRELTEIGYDIRMGVDINVCAIHDRKICAISRGGSDIANMIIETYSQHAQVYPIPDLDQTKICLNERIRGISLFMITYLESFTSAHIYTQLRPAKVQARQGGIDE
ncbi:MAG: hypothetical protein EBQ92_01015, partial [Proteobacteria bacterium]|nr:hypothetical protein [Pseudomonadota bacterium]